LVYRRIALIPGIPLLKDIGQQAADQDEGYSGSYDKRLIDRRMHNSSLEPQGGYSTD
jgi:hypothetical protein